MRFVSRTIICVTIGIVVSLLTAFSSHAVADDTVERVASPSDASRVARDEEKKILASLARRMKFECDGIQLNEAIHQLSKQLDTDILFDNVVLAENGISTDQIVSLHLGELTAWQILHFLLKPLQLTWVANDGFIEITTQNRASEVFVTRVYDVRNLCKLLEPLTREILVQRRRNKPQQAAGGMGVNFFSIPVSPIVAGFIGQFGGGNMAQPQAKLLVPKSVETILAEVIRSCTELVWEDESDNAGSIQLGQGCLIIRQNYHGQFEIAGMLEALEQFVGGKVQGKSFSAGRLGYPIKEDAAIYQVLAKPTTVVFEEEPLGQALTQTLQSMGIPVWIDETSAQEAGVSFDHSIGRRHRMQRTPLAKCLKKVLEPSRFAFYVEEGVLVATSTDVADEKMTLRFYDISGITKVHNDEPDPGVVSILSRSTTGRWAEITGEGGSASLVSSKHLAVRQTAAVHDEIAMLIDELSNKELSVPDEPTLELRVYTAPDAITARDFERVLPQLIDSQWSHQGSIRHAGNSLFIKQPPSVHDRLDEIMQKYDESRKKQNDKTTAPTTNEPAAREETNK